MTVTTALVLGCNGQAATFLCRRVLEAGERHVIGLGHQAQPRLSYDPSRFRCVSIDLAGQSSGLRDLLAATRPQRIFHVAATHASAGSPAYEAAFKSMLAVNVRSVHMALQHPRTSDPGARLVYASWSKAFGPLPTAKRQRPGR
jgi:GDPmannose 4,6-dehydratase